MLFRHQGLLHDARCPSRKVPTQDLLAFFVQWCHLPLFLIFQIPRRFWAKCLKFFGCCSYFCKKTSWARKPQEKEQTALPKETPKQWFDLFISILNLAAKKGNTIMGFQALMGRMDPYFCFARKIRSLSYLSGNPPLRWNCQLKWPWKFPLTFLRPARRVCRRLASRRFKCQHWFTQKRAQLYIRLCFLERFLGLTHQRVPFITTLNSFDFFCPQVFLSQKSKVIFFSSKKVKNLPRQSWKPAKSGRIFFMRNG